MTDRSTSIDHLENILDAAGAERRPLPRPDNDAVMEKVDRDGHVIGFSILDVRQNRSKAPVSVTLHDAAP